MKDGKILFAIQEERLSKIKHDSSFPLKAIKSCLVNTGISVKDIDLVTYYEKPFIKFDRIVNTFISLAPKGFNHFKKVIIDWSTKKLFIRRIIKKELSKIDSSNFRADILFSSHHLSHAALGYFSSDYKLSSILVIDAIGENATTSIFIGEDNDITLLKEYTYPNSYGLLYSSFTEFLGFRVNSDEFKLMGLSGYGLKNSSQTNFFIKLIFDNLISIKDEYFHINQKFFSFQFGNNMIDVDKFEVLFSMRQRMKDSEIDQSHCNLALAIQTVLEHLLFLIINKVKNITKSENLIISGGVALNTVAMGKIREMKLFKNVYIPFAPGDSGTSIGAILATWNIFLKNRNRIKVSPYLGTQYSDIKIENFLVDKNISFKYYKNFDKIIEFTCDALKDEKIIAWFQNRSEFGERALGNRSIIADPSIINGKYKLNSQIKFREDFRPFAPAILEEEALNYFEFGNSKFMQFVSKILMKYKRDIKLDNMSFQEKILCRTSDFACVTHIDFTSRLQTVSQKDNVKFWKLLSRYKTKYEVPMLVNTSLNLKGQPIVEEIEDALLTFNESGLDFLIIESFIISKN